MTQVKVTVRRTQVLDTTVEIEPDELTEISHWTNPDHELESRILDQIRDGDIELPAEGWELDDHDVELDEDPF